MSASPLITTYLGSGLLASRPATPSIPTNGLAVWRSTDTGTTSVYDTAWHDLGSGGGGGGNTPPSVRGTPGFFYSSTLTTFTYTLPGTAVAGDTVFVFIAGGYGPSTPSGWILVESSGGTMAGLVAYKILTSGDITTGSVSASTGGAYASVAGFIVFIGSITIRGHATNQSTNTLCLNSNNVQQGDYVLGFVATRDTNVVPGIDQGLLIAQSTSGTDPRTNGIFTGSPVNSTNGGLGSIIQGSGSWWSGLLVLNHL